MLRQALMGTAAGAVGTVALNITTYVDMALRARPSSEVPAKIVDAGAEKGELCRTKSGCSSYAPTNSARSQMAECWFRHLAREPFDVHSAGTEATEVRPLAVVAMGELGVDISGHESKTLDRYLGQPRAPNKSGSRCTGTCATAFAPAWRIC